MNGCIVKSMNKYKHSPPMVIPIGNLLMWGVSAWRKQSEIFPGSALSGSEKLVAGGWLVSDIGEYWLTI